MAPLIMTSKDPLVKVLFLFSTTLDSAALKIFSLRKECHHEGTQQQSIKRASEDVS